MLAQDDLRVFEDRLDETEHHQRVIRGLGIDLGQGVVHVQRERLVHGEVLLQIHVHPDPRALGRARDDLDDPVFHQGPEQLPGPLGQRFF